eukprot:TRINITY_DN1270_c0_g1_i1.p1 TRINITY_DN1270_c0_g1~~TRINITY_DN1270_c0_g1_i1.p1  ORF type:complete len:182 (+),score=34.08 TRINITY_DN1270_c0_g1_i1:53-598(+)
MCIRDRYQRRVRGNLVRALPTDLTEVFIYPHLFNISNLSPEMGLVNQNGEVTLPHIVELTSEKLDRGNAFLLDDGQSLYLWIGKMIPAEWLYQVFGVKTFESLDGSNITKQDTPLASRVFAIIDYLRSQRPLWQRLFIIKEGEEMEQKFLSLLIYDRTKAFSTSYVEFLRELQKLVQSKAK